MCITHILYASNHEYVFIYVDSAGKYILCVEHDLAILDYLSDYICCLYGVPSVYGVVTMPFSVREGINIFLAGFVPTENLRFRDFELSFKLSANFGKSYLVKYYM